MQKIVSICISIALTFFIPKYCMALSTSILQKVSQSAVKIEASGVDARGAWQHAATGFLWMDSSHVVTSLHVVDRSNNITVRYMDADGNMVASSSANVVAVLKDSDLVLLRVTKPQDRKPLTINESPPVVKQTFDVVGFPLNISVASNTTVTIRHGGNKLRTILGPKHLILVKSAPYPSVDVEILNLEGSLVPGHSGAPIVNEQGQVIGIADGGLESGAIEISWGIPVKQLNSLAQSNDVSLPMSPVATTAFTDDTQEGIGETLTLGTTNFTKLRTRTFAQLVSTADDIRGLSQLATAFSIFSPDSFKYDIYQDLSSGATVVIPEGAQITSSNNFFVVDTGNARMTMKIQLAKLSSPDQDQEKSVAFERQLFEVNNFMQAWPDGQWSYLLPMNKFGVKVYRRGWFRNIIVNGQSMSDKYFFETLASTSTYFLGIAAINNDNTFPTLQSEYFCEQDKSGEACAAFFASRKLWAQMVLGVQFSSFPFKF
ncbi:MAG: serine protease [Gallionella sp.]|nr:serine protease [Gallionella sp.]